MDTPKNFDTLCCPGHPRNIQVERIHRQSLELDSREGARDSDAVWLPNELENECV